MNARRYIFTLFIYIAGLVFNGELKASDMADTSAAVFNEKGNAFFKASRYSEALNAYTRGLEKARNTDNEKMIVSALGNIGNIYAKMGDFTQALYYQKQGYERAVKMNDNELQNKFTTNLVGLYCILGQVNHAKLFYKMQMMHPRKNRFETRYYALYNQGIIAQAEHQYDIAEYNHKSALKYALDMKQPAAYVFTQWCELAKVYLATNKVSEALSALSTALDIANKAGNTELKASACQQLAKTYEQLKQMDKAESYKKMYLLLSDSIFNDQQMKIANGKLFEYENKINQEQVDSLLRANNIKTATIAVFIGLLAVIGILALSVYRQNKNLLSMQKFLVDKNRELSRQDTQTNKLLRQYATAVGERENRQPKEEEENNENANIGLNEEQITLLLDKIATAISDVKNISQSDFSIEKLSDLIHSNKRYVSWVINERYGKNFRTLLNEKRINIACQRLSDSKNYGNITIRGIYEELGYKSPTSFNNAFKKAVGMTPSAYQRLCDSKNNIAAS